MPAAAATAPDSITVQHTFEREPHTFLQPSPHLYNSFLQLAKSYLDPLASSVVESQTERQKADRQTRKRKRRDSDVEQRDTRLHALRLRQVHVDGLDVRQVWQQAKRVLGSGVEEIERALVDVDGGEVSDFEDAVGQDAVRGKRVRFEGALDESEAEEEDDDVDSLGEEGVDWEYEGDDNEFFDGDDDESGGGVRLDRANAGAARGGQSDEESLDLGDETPPSEVSDEETGEALVEDKHGLNDGFFSIDQFNKHTQFLEQVDARGDSDDGRASDEEDIDWGADPLLSNTQPDMPNTRRSGGRLVGEREDSNEEEDDEEEEEDGPTFGDMDLNAPEGDSDQDEDLDDDLPMEDAGLTNTNNITYKDFFAPPARKAKPKGEAKKSRSGSSKRPNSLPSETSKPGFPDTEIERTISGVHRDLFEDDLSDDPDNQPPASKEQGKNANLSTHERQQLALRAEIRRLEAENVATKHWSMTGETLAPSRPENSLLEEDLDFERTGKPVPVITEETSEDIEALIKRRILARDFNEVTRRRATDLTDSAAAPRRGRTDDSQLSLSTSKHDKSLADEYADEHLRASDPAYVDKRSAALRKTHDDIAAHWAAVSAQLDALCNWRYTPKPPGKSLEVRVDAPAISMEDARPSGAEGEMGGEGMLAPQEVWSRRGGEGASDGQLVTKGGSVIAREELSREQKKRRRNREKERAKKAAGNEAAAGGAAAAAQSGGNTRKQDQADVVGQLKKGGAKVIDAKGAVRGLDGKHADGRESATANGAGQFRL